MPVLKNIGIVAGLVTGGGGVASGIAYSLGAFHPSIQVNELIKKENKQVLLLSAGDKDATEWKVAWDKYKVNSPWGVINEATVGQVPQEFKNLCDQKTKGKVYGENDPQYTQITDYCARDKTIADVIEEEVSSSLLAASGQDEKWKTKFDKYKLDQNTLKFKGVVIEERDNRDTAYTKISGGCTEAIKVKTTASDYSNTLAVVKRWCLA